MFHIEKAARGSRKSMYAERVIQMDTNWQNDPKLSGMDKNKLEMLQSLRSRAAGKVPPTFFRF